MALSRYERRRVARAMARSDRAARPRRRRGRRDQPVHEYFFRLPAARGARERFAAFGCIVRRAQALLRAGHVRRAG
jgi:hypothetical protein